MADLFKMLDTFRQMQTRLQSAQEELARRSFSGSAGGGMVTVEVDGKMMLKRVKLERSVVNPDDLEMLEDLIVAVVSAAQVKAAMLAKSEMEKIAAEVGLPPGMMP